ncbi:MAG TPA: tRNA-binding protein [Candidatus Limiplasma sp.]|nr:tRNA-binding protein [Candidatus Limiplasma sp.]
MITMEDFDRLDIRVGTVLTVKINRKSRNPAYAMTIDFGGELGVKQTSSQITKLYAPEDLIGRQIICCVNVPPLYIGLVKSTVRVLAVEGAQGTVLVCPERPVDNGSTVA